MFDTFSILDFPSKSSVSRVFIAQFQGSTSFIYTYVSAGGSSINDWRGGATWKESLEYRSAAMWSHMGASLKKMSHQSDCHFKREHDDENMVFLCFPMFSEHVQTKPATISNPKRNPWIYLGGGCPRCLKAFSGRMQNSTSKPLSIPMDPHFFNWLIPPSLLDPRFWPVQRPYFCVSFSSCDCFSRIFAVENAFQHVPAILVDFEG